VNSGRLHSTRNINTEGGRVSEALRFKSRIRNNEGTRAFSGVRFFSGKLLKEKKALISLPDSRAEKVVELSVSDATRNKNKHTRQSTLKLSNNTTRGEGKEIVLFNNHEREGKKLKNRERREGYRH